MVYFALSKLFFNIAEYNFAGKQIDMTQERKRNYRKRETDNVAAASTEMGNIPPQATDIEEAVLGAMMVNTESVDQVVDMLTPQSFYDLRNRSIFEAIYELFNERSPIDMLTVVEKMKQKGTLAEVGGPRTVPRPAHAPHHPILSSDFPAEPALESSAAQARARPK